MYDRESKKQIVCHLIELLSFYRMLIICSGGCGVTAVSHFFLWPTVP